MVGENKKLCVTDKILCKRIDKYFYRDHNDDIKKYSIYCIEKNCKKLASYNYEGMKQIYCNDHKKEKNGKYETELQIM